MLNLPLYSDGFPKKMKVPPSESFSNIHFMPLKNVISISPLPSVTQTLILFTVLNFSSFRFSCAISPFAPKSVILRTEASIWM